MANYYGLKGFGSIHDDILNNNIQDSLIEYLDWALLEKGNYFNVTKGELSPNGQDMSRLRMSSNDAYVSGQVWEGFRSNWVWQSGVSGVNIPAPIVGTNVDNPGISGVYVNDQFEPTSGVGDYSHYVDYFNGRVVFDNPIPTGTNLQAEFSYKYINVVYANNVPWLREIQTKTQQPISEFYETSTGSWNIPPECRLQLPAMAIEIVPTRKFKGYQLGGGQWVYTDVLVHCIAEDEMTRNKLVDIISFQNDKIVYNIDSNALSNSNAYPLDEYGSPVPSALLYPEILKNYIKGQFRITNTTVEGMDMVSSNLFGGIVRFTTEGIISNI
jgi:hypothetical protein|tara:strand:+ start:1814 stop:2794 length:981 start_codon:yes stop_codon:yes gene_type:complete